jgi:hypothetical protein
MAEASEAEITVVAGDVGFTGHVIARLQMADFLADFHDLPGEFMPEDLGKARDDRLGPRVPFINMNIRAADGPGLHPDEDLPRPGFGDFDGFQDGSGTGFLLDDGFHSFLLWGRNWGKSGKIMA